MAKQKFKKGDVVRAGAVAGDIAGWPFIVMQGKTASEYYSDDGQRRFDARPMDRELTDRYKDTAHDPDGFFGWPESWFELDAFLSAANHAAKE